MSEPLPKELVMEAWKARVGYSRESSLTQRAYVKVSKKFDVEVASDVCKAHEEKGKMFVSRLSSPSRWLARTQAQDRYSKQRQALNPKATR
jgi:phage-related minor tail protein